MIKTEKISLLVGGVILAVLAGIGFNATIKYKEAYNLSKAESPTEVEVPDFLIAKEDEFVIKNKISTIAEKQLQTESAYFLFLDKLLLSYYLSYVGDNKEDIIEDIKNGLQYDIDSMETLSFDEANKYYDKVIGDYKRGVGAANKAQLNNPNSLTTIINNYLVFSDFVLEKPENLDVTVKGLNAYFDLVGSPTPNQEMLENPIPELCVIAKIHPDLKNLPEELECDF